MKWKKGGEQQQVLMIEAKERMKTTSFPNT